MLVPGSSSGEPTQVVATITRKKGKKTARVDNSMIEMLLEQIKAQGVERAEDNERWRLSFEAQATTIETLKSEVEIVQRDTLGGGSETSSRSGDLHHLIKEKAIMETSQGEWRSNLLEGVTLPTTWPKYEWMKHWSGRMTIVRALMALQELQKNKTLKEAVRELKVSCNKLNRNISASDHRLLAPVLLGNKTDYEHDVWELCLLGVADLPYFIPSWMYICRTVKPVLVENTAQWNAIVAGGVWPYSCSDGFKIGRYKERPPFVPNQGGTQPAASTTGDPATPAASLQGGGGGGRRTRRFGRVGNW